MPQLFRGHGKGSPGPVHAHQGVDIRRQQRALECGGGLLPNTGALWGGIATPTQRDRHHWTSTLGWLGNEDTHIWLIIHNMISHMVGCSPPPPPFSNDN